MLELPCVSWGMSLATSVPLAVWYLLLFVLQVVFPALTGSAKLSDRLNVSQGERWKYSVS